MSKHLVRLGLAGLLCVAATNAQAAIYLGAAFVHSESEFETAVDEFEADDESWKGFVGCTFLKFLALEATYRDFGEIQETVGPATLEAELEGFDAAARGVLPLGKVISIFAKVGYANIQQEGSLDVSGTITDFDEDDWELLYGAGLEINFGEHFGLRGEWEEFDVDADLNSLSAGAFFKF
jgi:hypothetical protein